ncbi:MAG: hypothetical protein ABI665_21495 [Vicinamibacterales bacterium]
MMPAAPRRPLNPLLLRRVERSGKPKSRIAFAAGFPHYVTFYLVLREEKVVATPRLTTRLQLVADAVGFPRDEIFLDEAGR